MSGAYLLMQAGVTSLPPAPRTRRVMVVCERLGAVILRNDGFLLFDLLGRLSQALVTEEREARREAARRWPRAYWQLAPRCGESLSYFREQARLYATEFEATEHEAAR